MKIPHELFFFIPLKVVSHANHLIRQTPQLVSPANQLLTSSDDYNLPTQHSTIESGHSQPQKSISNTSEMVLGAMLLFIYNLTRIFYEKLLSLCQN